MSRESFPELPGMPETLAGIPLALLSQMITGDSALLILADALVGDTAAGKELMAQGIHAASKRPGDS